MEELAQDNARTTEREAGPMSDAPECQSHEVRWAVIVTLGRVVVEAETAVAARKKVERKG
jgi:hypothetical protein